MKFSTMSIEEVTNRLIDYRGKTPKKTTYGIKLITAKVIKDGFIQSGKHEYISAESYDTWMRRGLPRQWDILITTEAPLGEVAQIRSNEKVALAQRVILLRGNPEIIDQQFYFQCLKSEFVQAGLKARSTGTTVLGIKQSELRQVQIPVPPLPVQRKISSILSAYDDLIENNLRRIKILEDMAQNLYREWFVKFRFPGHENTRFVDSELGRIPEGWEVIALQELISKHIGGGWGKETFDTKYTEPGWVIRGTDIPKARHCNLDSLPFRYHTTSNLRSRKLKPGDIVFEVSGGSKDQPLGRTILISKEMLRALDGYPVICASFCKRVQPKSDIYAPEILYLSFLDAYSNGEIEQYQVQSTGISNYKWSDYIEKVNRCVPKIELQEQFCEVISSMFSKIAILGLKNHNLRQTRDLLLPKLISGEVDVSELDIETQEEMVT